MVANHHLILVASARHIGSETKQSEGDDDIGANTRCYHSNYIGGTNRLHLVRSNLVRRCDIPSPHPSRRANRPSNYYSLQTFDYRLQNGSGYRRSGRTFSARMGDADEFVFIANWLWIAITPFREISNSCRASTYSSS